MPKGAEPKTGGCGKGYGRVWGTVGYLHVGRELRGDLGCAVKVPCLKCSPLTTQLEPSDLDLSEAVLEVSRLLSIYVCDYRHSQQLVFTVLPISWGTSQSILDGEGE